ncbi:MAG: hypothetical protein AAGI54_04455 [Planctomycetota bacterium]
MSGHDQFPATPPEERDVPTDRDIAKRWAVVTRWLAVNATMLLCALGVRLAWGYDAQHRVDAELQAIRDRGDPAALADLRRPHVPDRLNAAWHVEEALRIWPLVDGHLITEGPWAQTYGLSAPQPEPAFDEAAYLASLEPALAHLAEAAQAPHARWAYTLRSPVIQVPLDHLGRARRLARLLADAAMRHARRGDHDEALVTLTHVPTIADTLRNDHGTTLHHLVAISVDAIVTHGLNERLDGHFNPAAVGERGASAMAFLQRRYATGIGDGHYERMRQIERVHLIDTFDHVVIPNGGVWTLYSGSPATAAHRAWGLAVRPMLLNDYRVSLRVYDRLIEAGRPTPARPGHEYDPVGDDALGRYLRPRGRLYAFTTVMMPATSAIDRTFWQLEAQSRVTSVGLAIWRYELDHGARPGRLADLVPDYLDAVPADPYAVNEQPIGYRPGGAAARFDEPPWSPVVPDAIRDRAQGSRWVTVFSVGADLESDDGRPTFDRQGEYEDLAGYRDEEGMSGDVLFFVDRAQPTALPAATP